MISPDIESGVLEIKNDIPQYIIINQYNINYTEFAELYLSETANRDDQDQNLVKDNMIHDRIIDAIIKYNETTGNNYNLFEILYLLANGITGSEPLLYKYDLYAFGLILREVVDSYTDALKKIYYLIPENIEAKTKLKIDLRKTS